MASNKRSRADSSGGGGGRFLRSTGTDGLVCSVCEDDIPYEGKHAELMPCECSLCHECLLEAHAERGSSPLCCPHHGVEVEAHQLFERRLVVKTTNYNLEKKTMSAKETMMKSARQYLWQEKGDVLKEMPVNAGAQIAVLCFAQLTKSAGEMKVKWSAVERTIARTGKRKLSEEDVGEGLCEFFAMLNPYVVQPSVTERGEVTKLMPRELLNHYLDHFTPLMGALYGLATGRPGRNLEKLKDGEEYPDFQSQYLACIAACDILIRCNTTYPGHFQLMLRDQLEMQKSTTVFRDLLSAFRLGPSREYSDRRFCKQVVENLLRGVDLGSYDMHLLNGDNVGFTILGKEASYDQWIAFQDIRLRKERLVQLKIHAEDKSEQLSREPTRDWKELAEADQTEFDLAQEVVEVKDGDWEMLSKSTFESIALAIELEMSGNFAVGSEIPRPGYIIDEATRNAIDAKERAAFSEAVDVVNRRAPRAATPRDDERVNERGGDGTTYSRGLDHGLTPVGDVAPGEIANSQASASPPTYAAARAEPGSAAASAGETDSAAAASAGATGAAASRGRPASAFYGHDITVNAVQADLSKKQSTCMIVDYVWNCRRKIMKQWYDEYCTEKGHPPPDDIDYAELPPASIGAFFMCDGQPAAQIAQLIAQDNQMFYLGRTDTGFPEHLFPTPNNIDGSDFDKWFHAINNRSGFHGRGHGGNTGSRFYGKCYTFFGGFHAGMKLHNMCGTMFGNFLVVFFGGWRDTYPKVLWILQPSDPRQLENELPHYILAHYRSAFIYLWESRGKRMDRIPTPAEVHEYMLDRAANCPFRQAVLLHLRYAEIAKIMKMAAKIGERGSVEHFLSCVRFALPLWATTHAVDYVRLGTDILTFMHCAPPAVKALYANECFTRLTATGGSEYADDNMEDTIKGIRGHMGRVHRRGMEKKMEHTCAVITEQPTQTQIKRDLRGTTKTKSSRPKTHEILHAKSPSILGYDLIHNKMQFWHPTNEPIIGDYTKEKPHYTKPNSCDLPGKESLNPKTLHCHDTGTKIVVQYQQMNNVDNPYKSNRSEKDVPLTKILATSADRNAELKKAIDRAVSLDADSLDSAMNKDEAGYELEAIVDKLNTHPDYPFVPPMKMGSMSKKLRIQKLIELRQAYFDVEPDITRKLETAARAAFKEKYPDFSTQSDLNVHGNMMYCLSTNILKMKRYQSVPEYTKK